MIGVTECAKQELKRILSANVDNPEAGLRLTSDNEGQLGLMIDVEQPGDNVVDHEGSKVLLAAEQVATSLEGITLDVEDTDEGPRLVVSRKS